MSFLNNHSNTQYIFFAFENFCRSENIFKDSKISILIFIRQFLEKKFYRLS